MITRLLLVLVVLASAAAALPGAPGAAPLLILVAALLLLGTGRVPIRPRAAQVACVGLFAVVALLTIAAGRFPFLLLLLPTALRSLRRPNPVRALRTARDAMILAMAVLSFRPSTASLAGAVAATLLLTLLLPRLQAERIARFEGRAVPAPAGAVWALPAVAAVASLLFVILPLLLPEGNGERDDGASTLSSRRPRPADTGGGGPGGSAPAAAMRRVAIGDIGRLQRDLRPILEISVLRNGRPADAEDLGALFRSGALEEFDGTTWEGRGGRSFPVRPAGVLITLPRRRLPKGEMVEQRLRFLSGGSDALYCLGMPTAVGGDGAKAGILLSPRGEILAQENYPDGATFTIRSIAVAGEYAPVDDEDLTEARHARLRLVPPGHERAAALARTDVMGGSTGLDGRALLAKLEAYLARRCKYSLDIAPPGDATPVEAFLFDSRRGHCELFASAAAVMLRSLGVPARVVVGFRGGLYDGAAHRYTLRGADAHAWVEAWFEETGWVTFDPTPGVEAARPDAPGAGDGGDGGGPAGTATSFLDRILRLDGAGRRHLLEDAGNLLGGAVRTTFTAADGSIRRGVLAAMAFAAAFLAAALALRRRPALPAPDAAPARPPAPVPEAWALLLERLAAMGLRRRPSETGFEFVARARSSGIEPPESLERLATAYAAERFGAQVPSDTSRTELRALAQSVLRGSPVGP